MKALKKAQKGAVNFIEKIPKNFLVAGNVAVILVIVIFFSGQFHSNKKVYGPNDPLVRSAASRLAEECKNGDRNGNRETCYKTGMKQLIASYNFSFTEQTLYDLQDLDEGTKSCHVLAHYMTREAVKKNPSDWLTLLDSVNVNACGSGFLHGILEAHLGDDPSTTFSGELSNQVCNRGTDGYRKRMCTHFMGHFFVVGSQDNVAEAVPYCDGVIPELRFDCLDGLFMEHNQRIALSDHGLKELPIYTPEYAKSLEQVCANYGGTAGNACWTEMAEVYAKTFGYDAKVVYENCYNQKNTQQEKQSCYFKGVVVLATYPYNVNAQKLTDICKFYSNDALYKSCTSNLISSLLYYSPKYTTRGIMLCDNITKNKEWCFSELGNQLRNFVPDASYRSQLCSTAPPEYRGLCANAI